MNVERSENNTAGGKDTAYFAKTDYRGAGKIFGISRKDRRQHMYVIGKTGTGKSVMLNNLIIQDVMNGDGLCVVDPHGELIEGVLKMIPKFRLKDVVYFNPADVDFPMGFNVLELPDPKYKHLVASGLMGIFTKIWSNVWSARMEYIMNNAILALLETPNTTLLGIPRLLVDKEYRQRIVNNVKDPVVRAFWINEYEEWQDKFRSEAIAPIQNKVGQFLSTGMVRNVVGQSKSTIDIFNLMNDQKIFLVNVSKGRIGEDNSALLGAMLITKIQLSAMERVRIKEDDRKDFFLYVDEFQNFATDSFAGVLSEARKYRLNLIIAHQYIGQLVSENSTKIRDAVFGNAGTMVIFRVGAADAEFLEPEVEPEFVIQDIVNLPNYHIYIKLMVNGITVRPFSAKTLPPFKNNLEGAGEEAIIEASRRNYTKPREQIEAEIIRWSSGMAETAEEAAALPPRNPDAVGTNTKGDELFLTVCSVCGKEAKTPFKPNLSRPVYCSDCYEKVKAGTIVPPKIIKQPKAEKQAFAQDALAGMGIEFDVPKPTVKAPSQSKPAPAPTQPQAPRQGGGSFRAPQSSPRQGGSGQQGGGQRRQGGQPQQKKEIHLSDLKNRPEQNRR
jgi:CxxC-x17-CxxC domain-containing protein